MARAAWIAIWMCWLCATALAAPRERLYVFPVAAKTDLLPETERGYADEILQEEMAALFWLEVWTPPTLADHLGAAAAKKVLACQTPACALPLLKRHGVTRAVVLRVERPRRRVFAIRAAILSATGRTLTQVEREERGGAGEVKYAMPGLIERLFAEEIAANSRFVTAVVETTDISAGAADDLLAEAGAMSAQGNPDEARKLYRRAAERDSALAAPWLRLAELSLADGAHKQALNEARQAVKRDDRDARIFVVLGQAFQGVGQTREAEKRYKQALKLDARNLESHLHLARLYAEAGKNDPARTHFERARELAPDSAELLVNLGLAYRALNRNDDALEALQAAIERDPKLAAAYPPLADIAEENKDFALASDSYAALTELLPDCAPCYYNHGRVLEQLDDGEAAAGAYRRTIELDETFQDAYYNLGVLLFRADERSEAKRWLSAYVEREDRPDQAAFVKEARRLLRAAAH